MRLQFTWDRERRSRYLLLSGEMEKKKEKQKAHGRDDWQALSLDHRQLRPSASRCNNDDGDLKKRNSTQAARPRPRSKRPSPRPRTSRRTATFQLPRSSGATSCSRSSLPLCSLARSRRRCRWAPGFIEWGSEEEPRAASFLRGSKQKSSSSSSSTLLLLPLRRCLPSPTSSRSTFGARAFLLDRRRGARCCRRRRK